MYEFLILVKVVLKVFFVEKLFLVKWVINWMMILVFVLLIKWVLFKNCFFNFLKFLMILLCINVKCWLFEIWGCVLVIVGLLWVV